MSTQREAAAIIGGPVSPYVRKVLAVCALKGVPYRVDPIVPFFGNEEFSKLSPLRRVPVFIDDQVTLCDSTVICEYLDERYPSPRLMPSDPAQRARARWLEEYADTRFGNVTIWQIFYHTVIAPFVFGKERDTERIARAITQELPKVMDYLEQHAPAEGFLFGDLSMADLAVAVFEPNLRWSRVELDKARWPNATAWMARVSAVPAVASVTKLGGMLMRASSLDQHRSLLAEAGVAVTETTLAAPKPQPSPSVM
jgi:glutathione S-transferase